MSEYKWEPKRWRELRILPRTRMKRLQARMRAQGIESWVPVRDRYLYEPQKKGQ